MEIAREGAARAARTSSSGSAGSTAAIRRACTSAIATGSTTSRARRSVCRSRGSPPRRRLLRGAKTGFARAWRWRCLALLAVLPAAVPPRWRRRRAARWPVATQMRWRCATRAEGFYLRLHIAGSTRSRPTTTSSCAIISRRSTVLRLFRRSRRGPGRRPVRRAAGRPSRGEQFLFEDARLRASRCVPRKRWAPAAAGHVSSYASTAGNRWMAPGGSGPGSSELRRGIAIPRVTFVHTNGNDSPRLLRAPTPPISRKRRFSQQRHCYALRAFLPRHGTADALGRGGPSGPTFEKSRLSSRKCQ